MSSKNFYIIKTLLIIGVLVINNLVLLVFINIFSKKYVNTYYIL